MKTDEGKSTTTPPDGLTPASLRGLWTIQDRQQPGDRVRAVRAQRAQQVLAPAERPLVGQRLEDGVEIRRRSRHGHGGLAADREAPLVAGEVEYDDGRAHERPLQRRRRGAPDAQ